METTDSTTADYDKQIRPVLLQLCGKCHGPDKQAADLRMDTLSTDFASGEAESWHDVLNRINLGEMPPPKAPQPTAEQRKLLVDWINHGLRVAAEAKRYAEGRVVTRRLTRYEYQNSMVDMLGVRLDYARELPPEPMSPDGFLNNGATLEMSPLQMEAALNAARLGLAEAIVSGERPEVFEAAATKTAVGKVPSGKVAGHEPVNPEFLLDIAKFPRRGEFEIQIRAGAVIPPGHDYPRLRLSLGCIPGIIHVPHKVIGEVDVTAPVYAPQTFTFRGRVEDFPQPGDVPFGNVDFNGMVGLIDFLDADGKELRYADQAYVTPPANNKNNKNKNNKKNPKAEAAKKPENEVPVAPQARLDIVIEEVKFIAPLITSWPPASHEEILPAPADGIDAESDEYVQGVLERFMTRAYRRPVTPAEVEQTQTLYRAIRTRSESYEEAIRETLASVLISPHFLYIVEPRSSASQGETINDYELATRLSYFLWSSMPDAELIELAAAGKLHEPETLAEQVRRMLADVKAGEFAQRFADQWFDLEALDRVAVNPEFFPNFDDHLKEDMRSETRHMLAEILRTNSSCLTLLDSDWTMLNRALAKHYGIAGPRGSQFERVTLAADNRRGGLLAQGSFLLANSNGEQSHPIKRAVWILDRLLDSPPAPPPPDVPELDPESADLAGLSLKRQLEVHRQKEACNNCHRGIDPWGIPLEHYDAVGQWREMGGGKKPAPVDAASVLPNGSEIEGLDQLKKFILDERQELFARSVTKRLATYALGRSLDSGDQATVAGLTESFIQHDFRLENLIVALVQSDIFQTK